MRKKSYRLGVYYKTAKDTGFESCNGCIFQFVDHGEKNLRENHPDIQSINHQSDKPYRDKQFGNMCRCSSIGGIGVSIWWMDLKEVSKEEVILWLL